MANWGGSRWSWLEDKLIWVTNNSWSRWHKVVRFCKKEMGDIIFQSSPVWQAGTLLEVKRTRTRFLWLVPTGKPFWFLIEPFHLKPFQRVLPRGQLKGDTLNHQSKPLMESSKENPSMAQWFHPEPSLGVPSGTLSPFEGAKKNPTRGFIENPFLFRGFHLESTHPPTSPKDLPQEVSLGNLVQQCWALWGS